MINRKELLVFEKEEIIDFFITIIKEMTETINQQAEEIAELKTRLNKNSKNSSKPPTSDGYRKPSPKSLRKPGERKPGGQPGHKGHGIQLPDKIDEIGVITRSHCRDCGTVLEPHGGEAIESRYVIDLPQIKTNCTRLDRLRIPCSECEAINEGVYPEGVNGTVQYGGNLKAFAAMLIDYGMVSLSRTSEILRGAFGVTICPGTLHSIMSECSLRVSETVATIREALMQSPVTNHDETGFRVNGKLHWLHSASNEKFTYMSIHPKRGVDGIEHNGVLPGYTGIAVHDCYSSYFKFNDCSHSLCNAHLLRELQGLYEETGQSWCNTLSGLIVDLKNKVEHCKSNGIDTLPADFIQKMYESYDNILDEGFSLNPIPEIEPGKRGKPKRGKARCLLDRLRLHKDKYLFFTRDFRVPFDNNQAERDIRIAKVKQKVSGGLRTLEGAASFSKITSFIQTARKHGLSIFHALRSAFLEHHSSASFLLLSCD